MTETSTPIALITGANRGLGQAIARALAVTGVHVIMTGRDGSKVALAAAQLRSDGLSTEDLELDVTSQSSITAAAEQVADRHGRLDMLINNAGILPEATDSTDHEFGNPDMFRRTFATNVFGPVAVTEAFLPLLRKAERARIVNVSTTLGSITDQADPNSPFAQLAVPAYRSSKAALNSVTVSLARALADTAIKVTSVCPGWVQTDLAPGNREQAPTPADEAAAVVVAAATLPEDAPSGTFVDRLGTVAW